MEIEPRVAETTRRPLRGATLLLAGAVGGLALLYSAFPSIYYMAWVHVIVGLWGGVVGFAVARGLLSILVGMKRGHRVVLLDEGRGLLFGWLVFVTVLIAAQLPLRVHFHLARPALEQQVALFQRSAPPPTRWAGLFRLSRVESGRCDRTRTLLYVENDISSAFVYAPNGIGGLCYNAGTTGHLEGPWFWMTED